MMRAMRQHEPAPGDLRGETSASSAKTARPVATKSTLRVELGRRWLSGDQVGALRRGSVVEMDAGADEPVDVVVNGRLLARGTAVVMDGKFSVCVKELVSWSR